MVVLVKVLEEAKGNSVVEAADILEIVLVNIYTAAPSVIFWIIAVILTTKLFRRVRGRAERLLLAGTIIYLVSSLLSIPSNLFVTGLLWSGPKDIENIRAVSTWFMMIRNVITSSGMICFIYAFWVKFKAGDSITDINSKEDNNAVIA
ncbi:hypothetical protein ACFLYQ_05175 [Chloroflexota bacterium]